jgi:hypothetical protein
MTLLVLATAKADVTDGNVRSKVMRVLLVGDVAGDALGVDRGETIFGDDKTVAISMRVVVAVVVIMVLRLLLGAVFSCRLRFLEAMAERLLPFAGEPFSSAELSETG